MYSTMSEIITSHDQFPKMGEVRRPNLKEATNPDTGETEMFDAGRAVYGHTADGAMIVEGVKVAHLKDHPDTIPYVQEALGLIHIMKKEKWDEMSDEEKAAFQQGLEAKQQTLVVDGGIGKSCKVTLDMGREVGLSTVVETTDSDIIIFLPREGRQTESRFVLHRTEASTQLLTMAFYRRGQDNADPDVMATWGDLAGENAYTLSTAYAGGDAEREVGAIRPDEPDYEEKVRKAKEFWDNHAFVATEADVQRYQARQEVSKA